MLVVNFYAGPGAGKSTLAAGVFAELKFRNINCELVREFVKDLVWEENPATEDQEWIYANQRRRLHIMRGKVDVVLTDAPLLLSLVYHQSRSSRAFKSIVTAEYWSYNNLDIVVSRVKKFNPRGRMHTLEQAEALDQLIYDIVPQSHFTVTGDHQGIEPTVNKILERI